MEKAVVLLSGGLDSAVIMSIALFEGLECIPLLFDYGQRHRKELEYANKQIAYHQGKRRRVTDPLTVRFGGYQLPSELTNGVEGDGFYVPARNSVFLSLAVGIAEGIGATSVWIGCNYNPKDSPYPDCHPKFIERMEEALSLGTTRGVSGEPIKIEAPIIKWEKEQVILGGLDLDTPLHLTWSCFRDGEAPCAVCESCLIRKAAFTRLRVVDPALRKLVFF